MYRALYRKWRPVTFSDVIGQENIVNALQNQILNNKTGHAYIFTGTRGTGKTTCAKIFAKAVNCKNINGANPCGKCEVCKGTQSGEILDIVEIDAASNNGVDNIRDLTDSAIYTPGVGKYKVYIIDEVHMLSIAAFNALLKIMEEPPSHIIFILATTEIHKVPATILSRCQRYDFMRIQADKIKNRLLFVASEEKIQLGDDAAGLIARLADGAMRDALSILDTCIGTDDKVDVNTVRKMAGIADKSYLFELSDLIAEKNEIAAIELVTKLHEKSIDVKRLCSELILHYRNLLVARVSDSLSMQAGLSNEDIEKYKQKSSEIQRKDAIKNIKILSSATDKMGKSLNVGIEFEIAVIEMCEVYSEQEITQIPMQQQKVIVQQPKEQNQLPQPKEQTEKTPAQQKVLKQEPIEEQTEGQAIQNQKMAQEPVEVQNFAQEQEGNVPQSNFSAEEKQTTQQAKKKPSVEENETLRDFNEWDEIISKMKSVDKLLYANMKGSKAYFDGKRVLIKGSDLFLEYMRQNKYSNSLIKNVIADVTGSEYPIGPYKKKHEQQITDNKLEENIKKLEQYGVNVVINDD